MRFLPVFASVAFAIGLAVPARADGADDAFLASLQAAGITFSDPGKAVGAGRWVCDTVGQGTPMPDVVKTLLSKNPALHQDKANQFAAIAANTYCPSAITTSTPNPS